ncbi:MAG: tetratricopeptide repeat protein [Candidatus Omnitrophota bacterium]
MHNGKQSVFTTALSFSSIFALAFFSFIAGGCGDNRYNAEKLLWKAQKNEENIIRKVSGEPTKQQIGRVISYYKKVTQKYPLENSAVKAHFKIGQIYINSGKYDEARQEFKRIIENNSAISQIASRAQLVLGKSFESQGNIKQAMAEYDTLIDLYPLTSEGLQMPVYIIHYYKTQADEESVDKAFKKAVRHYKSLIGEYGKQTNAAALISDYLAQAMFENSKWEEAIEVWDNIIALKEDSSFAAKALLSKAETYAVQLNNIDKSISLYEKYIEKYPKSPFIKQVKFRLGNWYLAAGQLKAAEVLFSALKEDYPKDDDIDIFKSFTRIRLLKEKGLNEEAAAEYSRLERDYPDNLNTVGVPLLKYRHYQDAGDIDKAALQLKSAISFYEKELKESSDKEKTVALAKWLFVSFAQIKDWDRALEVLESLAAKFPEEPNFLLSTASLLSNQLMRPDEAIDMYREVLDKFDLSDKSRRHLARRIELLKIESAKKPVLK